ncbi:MAG: hypothetical protein KF768_14685, partial [Phycisphaeraceae bacterium]|nr:hypothetical protein [Phycisphaeraceae bacterium]
MTRGIVELERRVGTRVSAFQVEVMFYSVECTGDLGDVRLDFADGMSVFVACAGDGTLVAGLIKSKGGDAPGFQTKLRALEGVTGPLQRASLSGGRLELDIGGHAVI